MRAEPPSWRKETAAALRGFAAPCGICLAGRAVLPAIAAERARFPPWDAVLTVWWPCFGGLLIAAAAFRGMRILAVAFDPESGFAEGVRQGIAPIDPFYPLSVGRNEFDAQGAGDTSATWPGLATPSSQASPRNQGMEQPGSTTVTPRRKKSSEPGLRARFRIALQEERAEDALALRAKLAKKMSAANLAKLDERLGQWLTRRFQKGLREGRATELLPALEAAATAFAGHERFAYFQAILPTVRQAAEMKAAALADDDDENPPPHAVNGHVK